MQQQQQPEQDLQKELEKAHQQQEKGLQHQQLLPQRNPTFSWVTYRPL
jgi:hypothetical protein